MRKKLKGVPVPSLPIEGIGFVATIMDGVGQRAQVGGCAHEAKDGSATVGITDGRSAEIVTPGRDVANEASGVRQVGDRLQVGDRVGDQLQ